MSAEPAEDPSEPAPTWAPDRLGIQRRTRPLYAERQERLRAEIRAAATTIVPVTVEPAVDYTLEEMRAARAAYDRWRSDRGPALTDGQRAARAALKRRQRAGGRMPDRAGERFAVVRDILGRAEAGQSLQAIADARGCKPASVVRRLEAASMYDLAARLRGRPYVKGPGRRPAERVNGTDDAPET